MAKGIFGPISTGIGLTPELMMEYANLTYRLNFDTLAKDWMDMIETEYGQHVDLEALAKMKTTLVANHDLEFENKTWVNLFGFFIIFTGQSLFSYSI